MKHNIVELLKSSLQDRKDEIERKLGGNISKNSFIHVEGITPPGLEGSGKKSKKSKKLDKYDLLHDNLEPKFEFSKAKKGGMLLIDDLKPSIGGSKSKSFMSSRAGKFFGIFKLKRM